MNSRVWVNPRQPQTLYIAHLLLYMRGGLPLVLGLILPYSPRPVALVLAVVSVVAAFSIANERRWGYKLGVVVAAFPLAIVVLAVVLNGVNELWRDPIGTMFDIALLALLVHPTSRFYQRAWPRRR